MAVPAFARPAEPPTEPDRFERPQQPPLALRLAAQAFARTVGADVAWVAVRESRASTAVIRCAEGTQAASGIGLVIEPGTGIGGRVLQTGDSWRGEVGGDRAEKLSDMEADHVSRERLKHLVIVPLSSAGLRGHRQIEGVMYGGSRRRERWSEAAVQRAERLGKRIGRRVRDTQRLAEVTRRWDRMWTHLSASGDAADHRLDRVAHLIAADVRTLFRSGIAIVFRLDAASGALHAVGIDGEVIHGEDIPSVRRGQVLPPGTGSAGRAIALGAPFIAPDYASGCLAVPRIMVEPLASLPPLTTMSFPLVVRHKPIGAVTVGRIRTASTFDYSSEDLRLAGQVARAATPLLSRAQQAAEHLRRHQGAFALSRFADSLTHTTSVTAVCEQVMQSVVTLVRGQAATVWGPRGEPMTGEVPNVGILGDPKDPRLERVLEEVARAAHPFWTSDLGNDSRLPLPAGTIGKDRAEGRAVLVVPMRTRDTLLGLLGVAREPSHSFTEADVELVQALADQAALGIANARAYQELQISNMDVLRHEKLVAMGRLASGLAHEIRNPLQNIVALTSELLERLRGRLRSQPSVTEFPDYLKRAHAEAKRAAEIVDRLLDHIRERTLAREPLDLRGVVTDAVAIARTAKRGPQIMVTTDPNPIVVRGDAIMLRQVVLNLLNNAQDAATAAGRIEVRATVRNGIGPRRAVVTVLDNGRGIAREHLAEVFEPFFTTKDAGAGVGLGLAFCQSFIEQHGGTIRMDSPGPGQGTTVEFELPAES
jgi:signal transduction histidine kinase